MENERGAPVTEVAGAKLSAEPDTTAAARDALVEMPRDVRSLGVLVLSVLAVFYTLYLAKEILLPIVMAFVLKLLLQPIVRVLHAKLRLPQPLAALAMIVLVFGVIAAVGFSIAVPASGWMSRAPQTLPLLQQRLAILREPIAAIQHAFAQLAAMMQPAGATRVVIQDNALSSYVFSGTRAIVTGFFETILILFFLLAAGDTFLRRLVEILPGFAAKKGAVEISTEIEEHISGYLLTITVMNLLVGIATGIAMWLTGIGDPLLWGTVAFLLNYIPILGPLAGVVIFLIVGLLSFDQPWWALIPAGIYLCIHVAEGETITPMLLARRFTLNPVLVIVSLVFWDWMWGIPGALLAVPLLAIFKIVCDHIKPLTPVGHFIGA